MALTHDDKWSSSSSSGQACLSFGCGPVSGRATRRKRWNIINAFYYVGRLIAAAFSAALTLLFAVVAIAGATIAMEFLDALRTYWYSESPGSYGSSSMADFLQELVHGRFVNEQIEQLPPATSSTHDLQQVNRSNASYGQSNAGASEVSSSGLSADSLKRLPCHVLLDEMKACCTICLQDIGVGDTARSLPQCHHTFHLACVDRWLVIHGSCPVCRQDV